MEPIILEITQPANKKHYLVNTKYNKLTVIFHEEKGAGIYLNCEERLHLVKQYKKNDLPQCIKFIISKF